jgi:hypothetical protein
LANLLSSQVKIQIDALENNDLASISVGAHQCWLLMIACKKSGNDKGPVLIYEKLGLYHSLKLPHGLAPYRKVYLGMLSIKSKSILAR